MSDAGWWDTEPDFYEEDFDYLPFTLHQCRRCDALVKDTSQEKHLAWHVKVEGELTP